MELLEIREVEIREVTEDRMVSGIAVPYNQETSVNGYKERIEKGAFGAPTDVTLFYGHDHRTGGLPIGKVVEARDTEDGLEISAVISKTTKGDEVYTLLRDGVLNKFSIGFQPTKSRRENGVVVREKGDLKEISVVAIPAYANAAVSEVRSDADNTQLNKENEMTEINTAPEVAEIREAVSDLERKFAVLSEQGNTSTSSTSYRSGGEFLKALAAGDSAAQMEIRAFTGATSADSGADRSAWVNRNLRIVEEKRNIINLFDRAPLPASGNSIEYPRVSGTAGTVGPQAAEGDDLPYIEVTVDTATAPVLTYGGYSSISRQAIERSDVAYLDAVLRQQTMQYAKATNSAVRAAVLGATGVNTGTIDLDTADGGDFVGLVLDAAALVDDNGQGAVAEFVLCSRDVFRSLGVLTDTTGRPMFDVNRDGSNTLGSLNVRGFAATVAGMPVVVDPAAPAGTLIIGSREAVTVFESPGAPFRLQDENIINLTKDFSLYGYLAVAVTNPLGLVKVTVA